MTTNLTFHTKQNRNYCVCPSFSFFILDCIPLVYPPTISGHTSSHPTIADFPYSSPTIIGNSVTLRHTTFSRSNANKERTKRAKQMFVS
ncbi:hypothetical protein HanRHA438_Chr03g0138761 [Helianthus annuus]|nr:hypothetical protein HanRHA438_Chr03g0138761 [Helianthus annuus]